MRPADEHLTPQEFEQLLFETADSKGNANRASAQQAQQHLSGCAVCQSVAEKLNKIDSALRALGANQGSSRPPTRGSECPAEDAWVRLAAGVMTQEEMGPYVTHAAQCDWCGPLLKQAMEDLTQAATAEEQDALQKLPSASPDWQREMAIKLAQASRKAAESSTKALSGVSSGAASPASIDARSADSSGAGSAASSDVRRKTGAPSEAKAGFSWWPKLVWACAGLAVVAVAVWLGIRLTREPDVNQLLAQAYTEQRTIELRMPGAKYGPFRGELGPGERPRQKLYAAEAIITRESPKHPDDPKWLQTQARADLLQGRYRDAKNELDSALLLKSNDPSLLIDRATALYQSARAGGVDRSIDYSDAAEDLGKVLKQNPDDAVALFNRSIVYEKMLFYRQAIEDVKHYLRIDPSGPWADEARA
jgi:tetratricopeptide (TPR) repeat protein